MADRRANYALVQFQEHLGGNREALDVPWAEFVGGDTDTHEFEVTTADPTETSLQLQACDVGEFGREIVVNETPLSGFDIPPADGWQYWIDTVSDVVTVHWREPVP